MQTKTIAVLVGGLLDAQGQSSYARRVLFGTAGEMVRAQLPPDMPVYFVQHPHEAGIEGIPGVPMLGMSRFTALSQFDGYDNMIVIAAPFVTSENHDLAYLLEEHEAQRADITVLVEEAWPEEEENGEPMWEVAVLTREAVQTACGYGRGATLEDLIGLGARAGLRVEYATIADLLPIEDGVSAHMAQMMLMQRINYSLVMDGVQIFDPMTTYIAPDAQIEPGATILPGCHIRPGCRVGAGAVIGPNTILDRAHIGARTTVNHSQVYESTIGEDCTVGPFAYVRPDCTVGDRCRVGDFVELKKSTLGEDTKVSHLTYIGDATVGSRVNFGCGTVVVNYDGYDKNRTIIGDDCFIGCNTNLVSPVALGDRVLTAAGTTVTDDVPDGALAIARARQTTVEGWNDARRARKEQEKKQKDKQKND